jgi:Flp pilus assembly pilin Flp
MLRFRRKDQAQVFVEYTIIIGIVVMVLISMSTLIKRGLQAMIKTVADQIGNQANAEQTIGNFSKGFLESQYSSTRQTISKTTTDLVGEMGYGYDSVIDMEINTVSNLGFTQEN